MLAHCISTRLSIIKSTVVPMELAKSSRSKIERLTYLVTKLPSITPLLRPLFRQPRLLRLYNLHSRGFKAASNSRAFAMTDCNAMRRQKTGSLTAIIDPRLPSAVPKWIATRWSSSCLPNSGSCCLRAAWELTGVALWTRRGERQAWVEERFTVVSPASFPLVLTHVNERTCLDESRLDRPICFHHERLLLPVRTERTGGFLFRHEHKATRQRHEQVHPLHILRWDRNP